ncbi:MAG: hypothetical protein ACREB7_01465 [Sphingopyxis sp.]|uniref:hypothetical protein n=1 Tax=Sphingopyxis sp. TaxID=1908224 RepID=UPI003D6CABFF
MTRSLSSALAAPVIVALALLVTAMLALAPAPAAAQTPDYSATNCISSQQSGSAFHYTNTCSETILLAYCLISPGQPCESAGGYNQATVAAGGRATAYLSDSVTNLQAYACKATGELYWFDGDPYFGLKAGYRCRANQASLAKQQAADEFHGSYAGTHWSVQKLALGGSGNRDCTAILNHGALGLDAAGTQFTKERYGSGGVSSISWSGACDSDGLISGSGSLILYVFGTMTSEVKEFEAVADRGVLIGNARYYPSDYEEEPGDGVRFDQGCNNWNGVRPNSCDPARGVLLRQQYLAARGPAPKSAPQSAPRPAATTSARPSKPVAAVPAKPAGPVAIDIPPSETGTLNGQQNAAAADWLKKDNEAKRIQAEKVADFERKQAEFNRQQAEYQRQQDAYRAATAAHQAEVARIARANADIDACNKGDRSRCPTPN